MVRICPQCAQENSDQSGFCVRCGFRFSPSEDVPASSNNYVPAPTPSTAATPNSPYGGYAGQVNTPLPAAPQSSEPAPSLNGGSIPYAPLSGVPAYYGNDPYGVPGGVYQQQQQVPFPGMVQPTPAQPYFQTSAQHTAIQGLSVVQRAFAGKGTPLIHTSWLLDGKQVSPEDLCTSIVEKVQQRYPNEVKVSQERLSERDAVLEERSYIRIERAPANVFIYVTSFGPDLYIARTTTVQPTLSPARIALFGSLFLFMLIGFIGTAAGNLFMTLIGAVLFVFFLAIVLHSLILGFAEKDFLVYLRPNILNDFRLDDGAILEHIADKGVAEAVEGFGLDATSLSVPIHNYSARQPLHLI